MRRNGLAAAIAALITAALIGGLSGGEARATGLRVGVRLHQEMGAALVPTTRNFRLCFTNDGSGVPRLGLCSAEPPRGQPAPEGRAPAVAPQPPARPAPKPGPRPR